MHREHPQPLPETERVLRTINVLTWIPGFAFLMASGVARDQLWAFIGLAPLSLSALFGALVILVGSKHKALVAIGDLFLAMFTLSIDIVGWVTGNDYWTEAGMLGGVASSTLLLNFCIHAFFVLSAAFSLLDIKHLARLNPFSGRASCSRCPHCLNEARAKKTKVPVVGPKESYHRVPGRDDEYDEEAEVGDAYQDARPSTDDEHARLV